MPDQLSARCWVASPGKNVECNEMVRRGPEAKIQTLLSATPLESPPPHDPQPLFDIRPVMAGCPEAGGSNTPTDVKNSSLPMWTLSATVPACGWAVASSGDTPFSCECV